MSTLEVSPSMADFTNFTPSPIIFTVSTWRGKASVYIQLCFGDFFFYFECCVSYSTVLFLPVKNPKIQSLSLLPVLPAELFTWQLPTKLANHTKVTLLTSHCIALTFVLRVSQRGLKKHVCSTVM